MAKIVFLDKQTNICRFKYEWISFSYFTLRNIVIGQYNIYRKQSFFFQKWDISVQQKQ